MMMAYILCKATVCVSTRPIRSKLGSMDRLLISSNTIELSELISFVCISVRSEKCKRAFVMLMTPGFIMFYLMYSLICIVVLVFT